MNYSIYININGLKLERKGEEDEYILIGNGEKRIENLFFIPEKKNAEVFEYFWNNISTLTTTNKEFKVEKIKQNIMIKWIKDNIDNNYILNSEQEKYLVKYLIEELIIGNNVKYDIRYLISKNKKNYQDLIWFLHEKVIFNLEETRVYYKNEFENIVEYHVIGNIEDIIIFDDNNKRIDYRNFKVSTIPYIIENKCVVERHIIYIEKNYRVNIVNNMPATKKKSKYILFMDRLEKADDNAEWMFKYCLDNGYKNCYFVIGSKEEYKKYKKKYGNVLLVGSRKFKKYYKNAKLLVSSGLIPEFTNYQGIRNNYRIKYLFLQHGYITDDLSDWLMGKKYDYIIVSDQEEEKRVKNFYSVHEKQIKVTGLARYDNLKYNNVSKVLLIAPTWRYYLKSNLKETEYVKKWNEILKSDEIKEYAAENNLKIVLKLHPEFEKYSEYFVLENSNATYKELINNAEILITDYSSIFMDMHLREKKIIFYQFDIEEFYKNHTYKQLLDYNKLDLNDVCYKYEDVVKTLNEPLPERTLFKNDYKNRKRIASIIEEMIK